VKHAIFISYRRDDAEGEAGRLYDDLVRAYDNNSVFMDVAGIAPGLDFRKAIDDNVAVCGVFLAVIGPQWATIAGANGQRRLDDANDFVRLEIASALARNIAVIPVLVHESRMPHPDQLPDSIKDLAYRNSVEISHARWNSDVQLLINALRQYVTTSSATETEPVHATVSVQLPPPVSTEPPPPAPKSRLPLILGAAAAVLVLAVIGFFIANRHPKREVTPHTLPGPPSPAPEPANVLTGVWRNPDPRTGSDALLGLRINGSGPGYNVEPFGKCPQGQCSWGVRTVILDGGPATNVWTPQNTPQEISQKRTVTLTLQPLGGKLSVQVRNTFWPDANSKPHSSDLQFIFERAP
jgi:hypothetical protein